VAARYDLLGIGWGSQLYVSDSRISEFHAILHYVRGGLV